MDMRHPEDTGLSIGLKAVTPLVERGNGTRFRIMSHSATSLWGSAGTGRRARLRTACRKACGFESHLPHHYTKVLLTKVPLLRIFTAVSPARICHNVAADGQAFLLLLSLTASLTGPLARRNMCEWRGVL